jgi:3-hydroxybutyryl-CoA dehydratase
VSSFNVGDSYALSFQVTKDHHNAFLDLFKDQNPMHASEGYAKKHGFSDVVMHGNILNGFLSYFVGEQLPVKNVVIVSQEIKFKNPVFLNDTLAFEAKVAEVFESVNLVVFKYVFKNIDGKKVALGRVEIKELV